MGVKYTFEYIVDFPKQQVDGKKCDELKIGVSFALSRLPPNAERAI